MATERLDVRLDHEHRRRLEAVAAARGVPLSIVVREMIDRAYEEIQREERLRAAKIIGALAVEVVPDPETLAKQIASTYDLPDLP
jgi:hypothetical protein